MKKGKFQRMKNKEQTQNFKKKTAKVIEEETDPKNQMEFEDEWEDEFEEEIIEPEKPDQ